MGTQKLVTAKQGEAVMTKKTPDGSEENIVEKVGEERMFDAPTCNVGVNAKFTMNLGNYNSVQLGCSLNVPCKHDEIDEVHEFAKDWVNDKMSEMIEEAKEMKGAFNE